VSSLVFVALIAGAQPASAFCRLTTCQPADNCPTDEKGCPSEGAAIRWTKLPVPFRVQAREYSKIAPTALRGAIRAAFDRWTTVDCDGARTSLRFHEQPEAAWNQADAPFAVTMVHQFWPFDGSALAQTTHDFGKESGVVKNAVIQLNTASHEFRVASDDSEAALTAETGADIEAVLVHEVGHYIGLAHSNEPSSMMAPSYCQDAERCKAAELARELAEDDVEAVCALYPPANKAPIVETDPGPGHATSFGCTQASSSRSSGLLPVGLALVVVLALVRKRALGT
jgi:hypothetical protein